MVTDEPTDLTAARDVRSDSTRLVSTTDFLSNAGLTDLSSLRFRLGGYLLASCPPAPLPSSFFRALARSVVSGAGYRRYRCLAGGLMLRRFSS